MNLLVLTTTFPKSKDDFSTPRFVYELSYNLSNKGFNTIILTPDRPDSKKLKEYINDNFKIYRFRYFLKNKQILTTGEGIIPSIKKYKSSLILIPFLIIKQYLQALKLIKKYKINIINSHWMVPSGLLGAVFQKFLKRKNYVVAHAAALYLLERIPFGNKIAKFIFNNSIRIIVVSNYGKDKLYNLLSQPNRQLFDHKVKVIPMGTYLKKISDMDKKLSFSENSFNVLFIGRIVEKKGLKYVIKALKSIKDKDIYLHICGMGPLIGNLKELTKYYGLDENIKFYGYITEEAKIMFLKTADILIVPSIETTRGDKEGLPVVILEALGAGLPIIASNVGGIKDGIIDDYTGILIEQKNIKEIERAILYLKNNRSILESMRKNCKEYAKKFDWNEIAEKFSTEIKTSFNEI